MFPRFEYNSSEVVQWARALRPFNKVLPSTYCLGAAEFVLQLLFNRDGG